MQPAPQGSHPATRPGAAGSKKPGLEVPPQPRVLGLRAGDWGWGWGWSVPSQVRACAVPCDAVLVLVGQCCAVPCHSITCLCQSEPCRAEPCRSVSHQGTLPGEGLEDQGSRDQEIRLFHPCLVPGGGDALVMLISAGPVWVKAKSLGRFYSWQMWCHPLGTHL